MTQLQDRLETYRAGFHALLEGPASGEPGWLRDLRLAAWSRFAETGFPTARRGNERWKYTNLRPLAAIPFETPAVAAAAGIDANAVRQLAPWSDEWTNLVFVDGRFSAVLSTAAPDGNGIVAGSLSTALAREGEEIRQNLSALAPFDDDAFAALNTALLYDGAFVRVPDGSTDAAPVNLVFVTSDQPHPRASHPRTLALVGKNARLTLLESHVSLSSSRYFTNAVMEMNVGAGAQVEHCRLMLDTPDGFHVGSSRVRQDRDSSVNSATFTTGAAMARNDFQVTLDAPGAFCDLKGLYATAGNQHIDNLISIDHAMPHTTSRLFYKGILAGKSRAVFGGAVLVRKDAQKADARQTDKNLVLSHEAEVDSKPSLLIYADDVQCSHGATAGHIDQDTLFYMQSRGLDRATATRMLIQAFAAEIVDSVGPAPLRDFLGGIFSAAIPAETALFGGKR